MKRTIAFVTACMATAAVLVAAGYAGASGYHLTAAFLGFVGIVWISGVAFAFWLLADV